MPPAASLRERLPPGPSTAIRLRGFDAYEEEGESSGLCTCLQCRRKSPLAKCWRTGVSATV
jgi:hypothetical protein